MPNYGIRKPVALILLAAAVAMFCINVALILQNRRLKAEMAAPAPLLPQVGTKIDRLEGIALDGTKVQVTFTGQTQETLFLVFSTQCGVCELNWPQWQSIARSARAQRIRLVYADVESPLSRQYAEQHGIDKATLFAELDPRCQVALNLRPTPLSRGSWAADGRFPQAERYAVVQL